MKKKKQAKDKVNKIIRADMTYGSDDWHFAYITAFYIQHLCAHAIGSPDPKSMKFLLECSQMIQFCKEIEKASIEQLDIGIDPLQLVTFMSAAGHLSDFMVHRDGLEFTEAFLHRLRDKYTRFSTAKALEDFYLPIATKSIQSFNEHYESSALGDVVLQKTWGKRKIIP